MYVPAIVTGVSVAIRAPDITGTGYDQEGLFLQDALPCLNGLPRLKIPVKLL